MAREVSVKITANTSGFNSGMDAAGSKAAQTAQKIKASFDSGLNAIGKNSRSINNISGALGKVGLVAAVGFGAAVKSAAEFDSAMSGVAATGADARASLGQLREAAIKAGADTKFSATEAAGGVEALAKAGVSAKDTLGGGLTGALNLAAAGNLDVGQSAEVAASAMNQFGLAGKDIPHIADLLAQSAGTAQGEVSDMAAALNQSGLVANQFGLSIDETAQSLALFAKNGLVGSDAGTSFKTMLTSLYAPAGTGSKALDKLGVSAYDATGAIKPIGVVADELKAKLDALSEKDRNSALKNIFGSDALRSGTILLSQGSAGLSQMATEFGKFGSAADVARTKMDNLKGDLEQLKGSFETALIGLGEGGQGPLRDLAQSLTGAVNGFNKLGSGTKSAILAVAGIGAAGALGTAGVLKLATGAAEAYSAFGKLSSGMPRLAGALRGLGVAAAAVGVTLIALQAVGAVSRQFKENFVPDIEASNKALLALGQTGNAVDIDGLFQYKAGGNKDGLAQFATDVNGLDSAFKLLKAPTALDLAREKIDGLTGTTGALTSTKEQFVALDASLTQLAAGGKADVAAQSFTKVAERAAAAGISIDQLKTYFPQYAQSIRDVATANGTTITSTQQLVDLMSNGVAASAAPAASALDAAGTALDAIGTASGSAVGDLSALNAALFDTANAALATSNAQIGFEAAVDAAAAAADKNGKTLKTSSAAGRENKTALNQLAAAGQGYVQSLIDQGKSAGRVKAATADARGEFIKQAQAMGVSKSAAKDLADKYGLIPKNVSTQVDVKSTTAKAELGKVNAAIKDLPKDQQVEVRAAFKAGGLDAAKAKLAELKDKEVKVGTKGNITGAEKVKGYIGGLRDKALTVSTKGNNSGANAVKKAVGSVVGKTVSVKANANGIGEVYSLRAAIATVKGKTVTVTVRRRGDRGDADGGYIDSTMPGYEGGGRIYGRGGPREDNVAGVDRRTGMQTSWVSVGEFVTNARSYANNAGVIETINANPNKRFDLVEAAAGGYIRGLASGGKPKAAPPTFTYDSEVLRALTAQLRVDQAKNLSERRAADKELAKAMKKLNDTQSAALDSIKSLSNTLAEPYRSKSTDVDDVLAALQDGAADLTAFGAQIKQLKNLGLDQAVIDQITADGAINGGELASQIIAGGQGLVDSLNAANAALVKAGTAIGETAVGLDAVKPKKKASGGYISGPGTGRSDSIPLLASNGEYIVNAASTAANRSVLDAINYGRARINEYQFMPAYRGGGSPVQTVDRSVNDNGQVILQGDFGSVDRAFRAAYTAKKDNLTMARLSVAV